MEPRRIEPQDIRPGMRVRATAGSIMIEGPVTEVGKMYIYIDGRVGARIGEYEFTLLADAPKPDRPVGSHWHDPETGAEYVRTDNDERSYVQYRGALWNATLYRRLDRATIPRLTPVPAFDPAVLWPRAVVATVCRASTVDHESSRYYQCDRVQDHDGPHVEHVDAEARYVWGDPR